MFNCTLVFDQVFYDFCRRQVGFLADNAEQNHEISQAATGDMCEATAASACPWFS